MTTRLSRSLYLAFAIAILSGAVALHAQTFTVLYNFGTVVNDPVGPSDPGIIAEGTDGNLYSSTLTGGCSPYGLSGSVFKMTPAGKMTVINCMNGTGSEPLPASGVTLGSDGLLHGSSVGSQYGNGNIWKMSSAGKITNYNVLGGTNFVDGDDPYAPPVEALDGNFYGTTNTGGNTGKCTYGNGGCGVIYQITATGKYKVIYTFDQANGGNVVAPLALGNDGNFYGVSPIGGTIGTKYYASGVIFKVTPAGAYSELYVFCQQLNCVDGSSPLGGLILGSDGNFYGTTTTGGLRTNAGSAPGGVVFRLSPSGQYKVLYNFCSLTACDDGDSPWGGLVEGSDGNFYGATELGGTHNYGTIFQVTPSGAYTVLYNFDGTTGRYPKVSLVQHTNGILYGDTAQGGTAPRQEGVFFSMNLNLPTFSLPVVWWGKVGAKTTILGDGFKTATAVSFNGTPATFKATNDFSISATIPIGATSGPVTVTTSSGTVTLNHNFTVLPGIVSFAPLTGPAGTAVTIEGTGFTGATKVTFDGLSATYSVTDNGHISATVPTGAKTGKIVITSSGGALTSPKSFTVTQ